ncbi:hypothetical protein [Saccharopolyspora sp. NPDC002376]
MFSTKSVTAGWSPSSCLADDELARMLTDFARERTAAGRPIPDDVHLVLRLRER